MTALSEYQRLEARGLWRDAPDAQRREVIVSLGDATLTVSDLRDRPVTHWSLPVVVRLNPGMMPALYGPDGDSSEVLELGDDASEMIEAIGRIRSSIERRRPHPGRLRGLLVAAAAALALAAAVFWLPGAVERQALGVVPDVKRQAIGEALLARIQRVAGPVCDAPEGVEALDHLAARLPGVDGAPKLHVVRDGVRGAAHLPGGIILLNRSVIEKTEDVDVVAGYVIVEQLRAREVDPLRRLLDAAGFWATIRLLTTGSLPDATLDAYAEELLLTPKVKLETDTILAGFRAWGVRSSPWAWAVDGSGESTLGLIEADPLAGRPSDTVLRDADWLRLQGICGG